MLSMRQETRKSHKKFQRFGDIRETVRTHPFVAMDLNTNAILFLVVATLVCLWEGAFAGGCVLFIVYRLYVLRKLISPRTRQLHVMFFRALFAHVGSCLPQMRFSRRRHYSSVASLCCWYRLDFSLDERTKVGKCPHKPV